MLNFLRKHQRYFLIVITGAVVISFCFFGTYSTMAGKADVPDKELFKGVAGKPIKQQELAALCRLIESSPYSQLGEKGEIPNFLNDGVIEKDMMASGLGMLLAKRYFEELKPDLDASAKRIKGYRSYVHPKAPYLSAESVWMRFAPTISEHLRMLKGKSDQSTTETLALMTQLYLDQISLPPETLKQILAMQQKEQGIEADPMLAHTDLSLFGFKSMKDWFGPRFVPLAAQFIMNTAQIAEERGYAIKAEEIRADLYQNVYHAYAQISRNTHLSPEEVEQYFQAKIRHLGLDEASVLTAWKKVMLFRRLFEDGSGSVLIDPLAYQQFDAFAKENVHVTLYQLPSSLQLNDFSTMLKLQVYLEGVAADPSRLRTQLGLPKQLASLETIEKRAPEFVERQFTLEWSSINKGELTQGISVKETWDWETEDQHWDLLRKNFSEIAPVKATSKQERIAALNALDSKVRMQIDQFARHKMIDAHPERIQAALEKTSLQTTSQGIRMRGGNLPFKGMKDSTECIALLEKAALKEEAANAASDKLRFYSPDKENFYRIQVVSRDAKKKVLSFEEALKDGTLDALLDKRLEEAYPEVRKKDFHAFQTAQGQWRPLKEVKDQVGKHLFADLLKTIEDNYRTHFAVLPGKAGELPLVFYSNARMLSWMAEAQTHLTANPNDPTWIQEKTEEDTALTKQWLLEKKKQTISRSTQLPFAKEGMFSLAPQEWSAVKIGQNGAMAFYRVEEKGKEKQPSLQSIQLGHQILSHDAKRDMMLHILQKIQDKKAIDLTAYKES